MEELQFQQSYSAFIGTHYTTNTTSPNASLPASNAAPQVSFGDLLQQKQLIFSKHAQQRLESRQIDVTPQVMAQVSGAVESARAKGVQDALIISDRTAFIVNIPSSTVVTALSSGEMTSHVFTNIDGAVLV